MIQTVFLGCIQYLIRHNVSTEVLKFLVNQRWVAVMQDSDNSISLAWAGIFPPTKETKFMMWSGFHRKSRYAPGWAVTTATEPGLWTLDVGVVKDSHVPLLIRPAVPLCSLLPTNIQRRPCMLSNSFASWYNNVHTVHRHMDPDIPVWHIVCCSHDFKMVLKG